MNISKNTGFSGISILSLTVTTVYTDQDSVFQKYYQNAVPFQRYACALRHVGGLQVHRKPRIMWEINAMQVYDSGQTNKLTHRI